MLCLEGRVDYLYERGILETTALVAIHFPRSAKREHGTDAFAGSEIQDTRQGQTTSWSNSIHQPGEVYRIKTS